MCQFEDNCTKIEGVRVPHLKIKFKTVIVAIFSKIKKIACFNFILIFDKNLLSKFHNNWMNSV